MKILKYCCLFFCVMCLVAAITGIQSARTDQTGIYITKFNDNFGRIYVLLMSGVFAAGFYGIQKRLFITWKLGWPMLIWGYLSFVLQAVVSTYYVAKIKDFPSFWLPLILCIVGGAAVTVYWGFWWKRQKNYFVR